MTTTQQTVPGHARPGPGISDLIDGLLVVDVHDDTRLTGRITFDDWFHGAGGAVHGGAITMLFEGVLGRLANTGRTFARAAYVNTDFRRVTPIGRELTLRVWFEKEDGRKRFLRGTLHDGDELCAEAGSLSVELRPGQP